METDKDRIIELKIIIEKKDEEIERLRKMINWF